MNTNIILELRERDGIEIGNGNYETFLSNPIIIEAGDTVLMKQCFIDTIATSSQIVIPNDLTLIIKSGIYINDWVYDTINKIATANGSGAMVYAGGGVGLNHTPLRFYADADLKETTNYQGAVYNILSPNTKIYNIAPIYQYIDVYNNIQTRQGYLPDYFDGNPYTDSFNIFAKTGSLKLISPSTTVLENGNWEFLNYIEFIRPLNANLLQPYLFETQIVIKQGAYNPADLAIIISEKLGQNNANEQQFSQIVDNNAFLKSSALFNAGAVQPDGTSGNIGDTSITFASTDGNFSFLFPVTAEYWIGSSEIALEYDAQTDKFNWTFLHTPQYNATGSIIVRYQLVNDGHTETNTNMFASSKNGGIFFDSLTAVDSNGNYVDFWSGMLGFDLSKLLVKYATFNNQFGANGLTLLPILIDGENTTSGYYGLSSAIQTTGKAPVQYWKIPKVVAVTGIDSTIDNTINILSNKTMAQILNTYSHFLIEADLKFSNNIFGINTYRNIQGIVSKYYSAGSYTFGDSSNSVQYTHTGIPLILKSIKVRILTSNKVIDPTIGNDNTVYFQIVKASNNKLT